ncbi:hypothetical protein F5876DRAFT_50155 [Lentinula aff. lateritia]|uniref:Uncharacterized protein n=1 Tax=Lentinula aff. lateritia TaxID=2804960 RepID=A0ACC1TNZ1_9AGAR|nr:hypothetical protein F5876DRAFT_50155 [Lentinula aff. lateritia]
MDDDETYLLLLLSDSNLPTGAFVASSGFESYIKHGFGGTRTKTKTRDGDGDDGTNTVNSKGTERTTAFMSDSVGAYARSALPFVADAYRVVRGVVIGGDGDGDLERHLQKIQELDALYDVMTLNHVTKRASKSQGVALLTLYSKGFSDPSTSTMASLVSRYKTLVRAQRTPGHLPISWGILTSALGLTLERSLYLHTFLHARALLSASVRLNEIGPYTAQRVLAHVARGVIAAEVDRCACLRTGSGDAGGLREGPANTWPLGEILAARHDLLHSRIFNS